jgi:DNA-binding MarR family transcriptional regulator
MDDDDVQLVQRCYPQIYLACHVDHIRARSTSYRLSAKDSMLLSHLDGQTSIRAGDLARHLGVSRSTLSAALKRLETHDYIARRRSDRDRRGHELRLTSQGATAMNATSVLDRERIKAMLAELPPQARRRALSGLSLLARAALSYRAKRPTRRSRSS